MRGILFLLSLSLIISSGVGYCKFSKEDNFSDIKQYFNNPAVAKKYINLTKISFGILVLGSLISMILSIIYSQNWFAFVVLIFILISSIINILFRPYIFNYEASKKDKYFSLFLWNEMINRSFLKCDVYKTEFYYVYQSYSSFSDKEIEKVKKQLEVTI